MLSRLSCLFVLVFLTDAAVGDNWPGWRGPRGDGLSAEKNLPLTWNDKENVRWRLELPGPGNSSPVVWGERVFITQNLDKKGHKRAVLCVDRARGKVVWQKDTEYAQDEPTQYHPYCSATPVTDGQRIIACFGSAGLVCYDFEGKELWRKDLGKLHHIWGNASSPILYDNLVIMWCGPGERQFLLALDKVTGAKVWQHDEPGTKESAFAGSWSTPLVAHVGDHDEMILCVPEKVKAFDPKTGTLLWWCDGTGKLSYASPVCSADGIVVAFSGFHGPALAVKAGGKGDVTKSRRLWHQAGKNPQRVGSPVLIGEHVYLLSEPGLAQCFEIKTGKDLWEQRRLGVRSWSSMVAADGKIYVVNDAGETYVLDASPTFKQLARNVLGPKEAIQASPAVADGEIFIRSHKALYCIGPAQTR
jgi:outer membrane protein assembly factor BamB